jgi:hypothetical protein
MTDSSRPVPGINTVPLQREEGDIELFLDQFVPQYSGALVLVNGRTIRHCHSPVPDLIFQGRDRGLIPRYRFQRQGEEWCVWGERGARIVYPALAGEVVIEEADGRFRFPLVNLPVVVEERRLEGW